MRLLILQMICIAEINGIFRLKMEILWSKRGYFGVLGNVHILVSYPIISSPGINGIEG